MNLAQEREAMVDNQIRPADVIDYRIIGAFLNTRREQFMPEKKRPQTYGEYEIEFAPNRAMMTPRSFAKLLQSAMPKAHEEVLLIGSAMGYEAAILSQLSSTVIGIENQAALIAAAEKALANEGFDNAIMIKSALEKGEEKSGPYDLIFVNGAIETLPAKLVEQLKPNGRIAAIFVDEGVYTAKLVYAHDGKVFERAQFQASAPQLPGFVKKAEFTF